TQPRRWWKEGGRDMAGPPTGASRSSCRSRRRWAAKAGPALTRSSCSPSGTPPAFSRLCCRWREAGSSMPPTRRSPRGWESVAPASLPAQTQPRFAPARLARIDRFMQQYVDSGQIGGAVGLVLQDGRVVYQHAVGWLDKEAGRRMTPDALFRIASQTKALTTV